MGRGTLTPEIQEKAKELLGRETSVKELRLLPYMTVYMLDYQKIGSNIDDEERQIIQTWKEEGLLLESGIPSKEAWLKFQEILYMGYVDV